MAQLRTFVGIGFGPIQSGLFLLEAYASGNFSRYVVAEVDSTLVGAVRQNGGAYFINVAYPDRIERTRVAAVELYDPAQSEDREALVRAIAEASEVATALPSVECYDNGQASAPAALLAEGISRRSGESLLIYAAENHNHAAELLERSVRARAPSGPLDAIQFVNTVIGKMSGVVHSDEQIRHLGLETLTPATNRAVLVEAFNRILISHVDLPRFRRGIEVFIEKEDLLPFEHAKLYGHNAVHALVGYLAQRRKLDTMADALRDERLAQLARDAFLNESGAALIAKHGGVGDSLFTPAGYAQYADDLLRRMGNPYLHDQVARVIRDPRRKLGWHDRLVGTMRLALEQGIAPEHFALGAAAAALHLAETTGRTVHRRNDLEQLLDEVWGEQACSARRTLMEAIGSAMNRLAGSR